MVSRINTQLMRFRGIKVVLVRGEQRWVAYTSGIALCKLERIQGPFRCIRGPRTGETVTKTTCRVALTHKTGVNTTRIVRPCPPAYMMEPAPKQDTRTLVVHDGPTASGRCTNDVCCAGPRAGTASMVCNWSTVEACSYRREHRGCNAGGDITL